MPTTQTFASQIQRNNVQACHGNCSPSSMNTLQELFFTPSRVIPIIFLHGILGGNLRLTQENRERLKKKEKTIYQPDDTWNTLSGFGSMSSRERQLLFSPDGCEIDAYYNLPNAEARAAYVKNSAVAVDKNSPFLRDDSPGSPNAKTAKEKACERGWGELMFSAYGPILNKMEVMMNSMFSNGKLNPAWAAIVGAEPSKWGATEELPKLKENDLKQISDGCWYPVHAVGYNWVSSNRDESKYVAKRIRAIMSDYRKQGMGCEKVIVVTHSMGGLVARALCHPKYGDMQDLILGVVHGAQPAIGAAAAYYRMLAGFEVTDLDLPFRIKKTKDWAVGAVTATVLGSSGPKVTVILANGGGGLELLPSAAYGNGWLHIVDKAHSFNGYKERRLRAPLPEKGDPYEEIYKREGKEVWWGLLREEWINPARKKEKESGLENTRNLLDKAKGFHEDITSTFHPLTYAHWGCDPKRPAFRDIVWEMHLSKIDGDIHPDSWELDRVIGTKGEDGALALTHPPRGPTGYPHSQRAEMRLPDAPGDQTVPQHSAEHQANAGALKGIFRQEGYEHQASYKDRNAMDSALYCIAQIAREMKWQ